MGIAARIRRRLAGGAASTRELIKNIGLSFVVKGPSLIVVLAATPAYLAYFDNKEVVGLWFTLISILSWILTCDMDIGIGLRNELVYALTAGDSNAFKIQILSSGEMLSTFFASTKREIDKLLYPHCRLFLEEKNETV